MTSDNGNNFSDVEKIIGYTFNDKTLLITAFTHPSYTNEHKSVNDYQRLEYLGDAILDFIVGERLFHTFPLASEGELSKRRAHIVSAESLADIIDGLGLIKYIRVGTGKTANDVFSSENVKCDLYEAILGAMYLDCGDFALIKKFIWNNMEKKLFVIPIDYISEVLEYCAKKRISCQMLSEELNCETKNKEFRCSLSINGKITDIGIGKSKHSAKNEACKSFYGRVIARKTGLY